MAVIHNLSVVSNNLSGYDPVAGVSDGTTVGKSWILWKFIQALLAFDTNLQMITNSSPTPAFLQSEAGNLTAEPAMSRATTGDTINLYMINDIGLSATIPNAIIYRWNSTGYYGLIASLLVSHKITGGTSVTPSTQYILSGGNSIFSNLMYNLFYPTTTTMTDIDKFIFVKSSNMNLIMTVKKTDGSCTGYIYWFNPIFTGYRIDTGSFTEGTNFRCPIFSGFSQLGNNSGSTTFFEPFSNIFSSINYGNSSNTSGMSILSSVGSLPSAMFTIGGISSLVGGSFKFGILGGTTFKGVSSYIEGLVLANNSLVSSPIGTIIPYNSVYYLLTGQICDNQNYYRILTQLGS